MKIEPDIVQTLRNEEKLGKLKSKSYNSKQELEIYDSIDDDIEDNFSSEVIAEKYLKVYREILSDQ